MADPKPSGGSKSRTGCSECKRKRIKCTEEKPTCSRCSRHPERCSYALKLSWTQGRPFKKPRKKEVPWMTNLEEAVAASSTPPASTLSIAPIEAGTEDGIATDSSVNPSSPGGNPGITQTLDLDVTNFVGKTLPNILCLLVIFLYKLRKQPLPKHHTHRG